MKKLALSNQKVLDMDKTLHELGTIKSKPEFSMKVARNRAALKPFIEALTAASTPSEAMKEFDKKRNALILTYGKERVNDFGQSITEVTPENKDVYHEKLDALKEEYDAAITEYDDQIKEFNDTILPGMANDGELIEMYELPEEMPDGVSGNQLFVLIDIIKA
jgi:hypothetical protein